MSEPSSPAAGGPPSPPAPDAVGRGVLGHDPSGPPTLFVLAGHSLGSTPVGVEGTPTWLDLRRLVNLDAVGDEQDGAIPVEADFDGGPTLSAMWPQDFCDRVIACLQGLLESGQMLPRGTAGDTTAGATAPPPPAPPAPAPAAAPPPVAPPPTPAPAAPAAPAPPTVAPEHPDARLWATTDDRPLPGDGPSLTGGDTGAPPGELTLEDVVYHGGYPGQTRKRKKCVAVLDARGFTINGPHGPDVHLDWAVVHAVEAQNSDEAKFRLGIKTKRSSTVARAGLRAGRHRRGRGQGRADHAPQGRAARAARRRPGHRGVSRPYHRGPRLLVGLSGTGKSTVAPALAGLLGRGWVDLDREVERAARATVAEVFAREGEASFRRRELDALRAALAGPTAVVAAGGGIVTVPGAAEAMADATVVWLRADPRVLATRLEGSTERRPLLDGDAAAALARLAEAREPAYRAVADLEVEVGALGADEVAGTVARALAEVAC